MMKSYIQIWILLSHPLTLNGNRCPAIERPTARMLKNIPKNQELGTRTLGPLLTYSRFEGIV